VSDKAVHVWNKILGSLVEQRQFSPAGAYKVTIFTEMQDKDLPLNLALNCVGLS